MNNLVWKQPHIIEWTQILLNSYEQLLGKSLISRQEEPLLEAKSLFIAPFVVASHGIQADPILNYGNQKALELWEMNWQDFIQTPSRLTAEPMNRETRQQILDQVTKQGYIDNYQGIRISSKGKRFRIIQTTIWNLYDLNHTYCGQAATFDHWQWISED